MCGIVGYTGEQSASQILVNGLKRLEYRGYDSAGVAIVKGGELELRRAEGKLKALEAVLQASPVSESGQGIGHTRWATHGRPSEENAHPHTDQSGRIVLVHNGIIENYLELKAELLAEKHVFASETDTEVLARLVDRLWVEEGGDGEALVRAIRSALSRVSGYYALAVLANTDDGPVLVAVRQGPPIVVGVTPDGGFLSSDVLG